MRHEQRQKSNLLKMRVLFYWRTFQRREFPVTFMAPQYFSISLKRKALKHIYGRGMGFSGQYNLVDVDTPIFNCSSHLRCVHQQAAHHNAQFSRGGPPSLLSGKHWPGTPTVYSSRKPRRTAL